jgi:hypothetical protein
MTWLSVKDAATWAGVSGSRIYQLRSAGVLHSNEGEGVSASDVRKYAELRNFEALRKLGGAGRLEQLAAGLRERLHPLVPHAYPGTYGAASIPGVDGDLVAALGHNCLRAAARPDMAGCRWCWAEIAYGIQGGVDPGDTAVYRALFAAAPCPLDRRRWTEDTNALAASAAEDAQRRHAYIQRAAAERQAERERQAEARFKRASAELAVVRAKSVRITRGGVTASVTLRQAPVADDGGDLTEAILTKLELRRSAAASRGDQTAVATLNGQISRLRMGDR